MHIFSTMYLRQIPSVRATWSGPQGKCVTLARSWLWVDAIPLLSTRSAESCLSEWHFEQIPELPLLLQHYSK